MIPKVRVRMIGIRSHSNKQTAFMSYGLQTFYQLLILFSQCVQDGVLTLLKMRRLRF